MKKIILLFTAFICFLNFSYSQADQLDSSFGTNGIVRADLGADSIYTYQTGATQVLLLNDGSMYVIIQEPNISYSSYIAKRLSNGSPDSSFGNNGFSALTNLSIYNPHAAVQSDGKIVVAGATRSNSFNFDFALVRYNTDGSLDKSFSDDGKLTTDFGFTDDRLNSLALQSDGKIIVAGYAYNYANNNSNSTSKFALARYNTDGSPDNTFSGDGKLTADFGFPYAYAYAVAIQSDGKIVASGRASGLALGKNFIARYNNNGTLDNTFSTDGILPVDFNNVSSIAIQKDGKIVAAGADFQRDFAVARYNSDGTPDKSFSGDGKQTTDFGGDELAHSISFQDNGKIVVVGYTNPTGEYGDIQNLAIARYNTDGTLDKNFSNDGKQITDIQNIVYTRFGVGIVTSVAIQSNGKIVAIGSSEYAFVLVQYNADGSLDNTLDEDGMLTFEYNVQQPGPTYFTATAVQSDGKVVAAGTAWNGTDYSLVIVRYNTNGTLDNTFDSDGVQRIHFNASDNNASAVVIQSDGKIVVTGSENGDFALVRLNTNGSLDNTLSGDGKQTTHFDSVSNTSSAAIQSDGKIVVAGYTGVPYYSADFAVVRYNTDGSLDNSFSDDGKQITDFGYDDKVNTVAIQSDGKIVVTGERSIARYNTNGSLDITFSGDGMLTYDFPIENDELGNPEYVYVYSLAIQKDSKIVVAGIRRSYNNEPLVIILARYNTDGSVDNTFGENGFRITVLGETEPVPSVAIQANGKILVAGEHSFNLARYNIDGNLDRTFGEDGVQSTFIPGYISEIAIFGNKLYAVGSIEYNQRNNGVGLVARFLLDGENKAPTITLSTPFVKYTASASIKLNAEATDTDGTITKVEFYNGTTLLHTEHVIPYGYWFTHVPVGNYTLTAKAYDNSGNVTTSNAIKVSVVNYNVPPVVSIVKPADNQTYGAHASVRLIAKAKDANDTISKVEFYSNNTLIRTEYYYPYTYWWDDVQAGTYTITAVATDAKGLSSTSAPVHIIVEPNEAPTVSIITPANNQTFTGPADIKLKAAAKDQDGTIHKVEFYNGKTLLHTETLAPYGYLWKDVPAGTYTITAKAFDNRGAPATSAPVTVTVTSQGATIVSSRPLAKESKTGENVAISLKLYPNPAKNVLSINTTGLQQSKPSAISVISASGVTVKTIQSNASSKVIQLDVSSLTSGVYTVKIMSGENILRKQFVKL